MSAQQNDIGHLQIVPLGNVLGAEITGVDASAPFSDAVMAALQTAFVQYHLLCFRDQQLSNEALVQFSVQFGALEEYPEQDKTKDRIDVYNVANVAQDGTHLPEDDPRVIYQRNNARWHTDSSYRYIPSLASIMYGVEVMPEGAEGGETEFANMFMAHDALDAPLRERLEPLHMVHHYDAIRRLEPELPPTPEAARDALPAATHPVIRVHPERGGRRSLYFTCNTGSEIGGGTLEEGRALHARLREHVSNPQLRYRHRWQLNDLVMWDNRCLLHRAVPYDMAQYRRVFRRTTIGGNGPVKGPFSHEI
ncbi:MAG: TauD/TfdA family dioxygenase [Chromatiales bacterium]|jgi:alpha-ketoglutarate-dependent taurine dioxygenase|nr:TauD/TfdA family dioxygenase [Chromatiales bacterium]